jgi:hypothetical protein
LLANVGVPMAPGVVDASAGVPMSLRAAAQGGVSVCPGSGGAHGGVDVSPAKAGNPRTQVKATAAPSFLRFFMFSP